jgi:hypothetical protein
MGTGVAAIAASLALACSTPTGELVVLLEAEDTIIEGLDAGEGEENIVDGWTVRFSKYLVAVGDVHLERTAGGLEAHDPTVWVVDLATLPPGGVELTRFEALDAVRWDHFEYATPLAEGAMRHSSVGEQDFQEMVTNDWTYLVEGTIENAGGESCPPGGTCRAATSIAFRFGVGVATVFGPCDTGEGLPGITVTEGGSAVTITIHGDHLFFDAFPSGHEVIERRAQWIADADIDADGTVTAEELAAIDATDLFPTDLYSFAGAPFPIASALDFVRSQLATQGHFQGEGECPWAPAGGTAGEHEH